MFRGEARDNIRSAAQAFEEALPIEQRKKLGQFFTGLPLGKLLAHLALDSDTRTVLDPMAGHGDLLDATWEAATECGLTLDRLDGIEVDGDTAAECRSRLNAVAGKTKAPGRQIVTGDAFGPQSINALPLKIYDLVITNPPYVRYQSRKGNGANGDQVRSGLRAIIDDHLSGADRNVWTALAKGYSGLADLSVPSWLLAGLLVRPGGRLALVVPATWRSRDYADVVRYLLLRCFSLDYIVEDKQPGWFSDALVRTHLIVARRLPSEAVAKPVNSRAKMATALWIQVAPEAASAHSLVCNSFGPDRPESQFATWVQNGCKNQQDGITSRHFDVLHERQTLEGRAARRRWYRRLESAPHDLPLFGSGPTEARASVPDILQNILCKDHSPGPLLTLKEAGIEVGQGLRTGCNSFFYVDVCEAGRNGFVSVKASKLFNGYEFSVPENALKPVLRRQAELTSIEDGNVPDGRVLNLLGWVLPEDAEAVRQAEPAYEANGETLPEIMPDSLADYVRMAASASLGESKGDKRIPNLSAVATNVRGTRKGNVTPRFWYMLPDFAPRHLPAAFVARINHGLPWAECNFDPPLIIDANFSTIWPLQDGWTRFAIKALLNSIWCRAFMEALGTCLGGGALKLEATHLRQLAIPALSAKDKTGLDAAGKLLSKDATDIQAHIDQIILKEAFPQTSSKTALSELGRLITDKAGELSLGRRRAA